MSIADRAADESIAAAEAQKLEDAQRAALVPLDTLAERFGITERTLRRWLDADNIERHRFGDGFKAVRWGDILDASMVSTRWTGATCPVKIE